MRDGLAQFIILAFFAIISYLFLGANLSAGEIVAPMDLLLQFPGWQESGISLEIFNMERSDIVDVMLPRWIFMRNQIFNGKLPLWDPQRSGGQPSLFSFSNATFSIGFLVFLVFGDGIGFTLALLARLIIAGLGVYILCRTRLEPAPSIFAGITYMMCGFNASWLMWPQVETSMWIPWVLWAVIRLEERPTLCRMAILSLTTSALIFAGFPAVAGYGLYAAALLALWLLISRIWRERNIKTVKRSLWIIGGITLGFSLASIQLIPFIEFISQFDFSWRVGGSIPLPNILLLLDPFRFGQPRVERSGYVGLIPLILAVLAVIYALQKRDWRCGPLSPLFWAGLTSLTLVAVYRTPQFLAQLLYRLPVLSNNPNMRLLVLFGLELSILGAVGFQIALKKIRERLGTPSRMSLRIIPIVLVLLIIGIHIVDISRVGRAENAVVPAESFFPETPSILYVQRNILPGQSVLATRESFLISGTLTGYGLSEWFAHSYHTPKEKVVLEQIVQTPWVTPTAARFFFHQIDMNSELIDALAIRYILTSSKSYMEYMTQKYHDEPAPPMPSNILGQVFTLPEPVNVTGIELHFATYGRQKGEGIINLRLFKDEKLISESSVNGSLIHDNEWVRFGFGKLLLLFPGTYNLEIQLKDHDVPPITVWTYTRKDKFEDGYMTINGTRQKGDLAFTILGSSYKLNKEILGNWNVITKSEDITVFERKESPPGAYFLHENVSFDEPEPQLQSWDKVKLIMHEPNGQIFTVETDSSGWLVRTARYWPGWKCYVNGTASEIRPYLGILQVVHIDSGLSIVEWRYEPLSIKVGAIISIFALAIIFVCFFHHNLKRTRQRH